MTIYLVANETTRLHLELFYSELSLAQRDLHVDAIV